MTATEDAAVAAAEESEGDQDVAVEEHEPPPADGPLPDDRFLNREISWLDFNARVLALAEDAGTPLLERVKFLAIFASNLDEFFMVRVAGLKRRESTGLGVRSADGLTVRQQLALIAGKTRDLMRRHADVFTSHVEPELRAEGVHLVTGDDLDDDQRERVAAFFAREVFPVLTPLAVDPAHPFPYISGLSLNLAVLVRDRRSGAERFARVKVPNNLPRFVRLDDEGSGEWLLLPMEEVVAQHLDQLFPGKEVVEHHLFRVTRNADLEVEEDRDEDLLQALERELARRRFGPAVRLEVAESMEPRVLELLERELEVDPADVQRLPGLLDLSSMWELYGLDVPRLKDSPHVPASHPALVEGESAADVFSALRDADVLVHHPYDSFATSVQRFIEQAAGDPNVLAIKQTLYRTSGDSPVVDALVEAAEAGKQVVVLVELKARFDEDNNIRWARKLERAGCHVVYGLIGLKTHTKIALVVRSEGGRLRRYSHVGTGNYNPKTARIYEDLGLLTADPDVGADLTDLFNTLTGYSDQREYRRLLVAPHGVRRGVVERVEAQVARVRDGGRGRVRMKVNSLVDEDVCDALYRASQAGVQVDLVVRGICSLRPGVEGLSENIRVRSVVGRWLEHSRIFAFGEGDEAEHWIGSADLMHRNLDRRVEAIVRVVGDPAAQLEALLGTYLADDADVWELGSDGCWTQRSSTVDGPLRDVQTTERAA